MKINTITSLVLLPLTFAQAQSTVAQKVKPDAVAPATSRFTLKQDLGYIYNFSDHWRKTIVSGTANSGNFTSHSGHSLGFGASFNWTHSSGFAISTDYIGFKNRWTIKDVFYNTSTDYSADYHIVTINPAYRFSLDQAGKWGFKLGLGLGFSVSNLSYQQADNIGGYTYVAQRNLKWIQPNTANPVGTITNTEPINFSNRIQSSNWNNLPIPYNQFDNTSSVAQTQRISLFEEKIKPNFGFTVKPNIPFKTEYGGFLNINTNYNPASAKELYLRLTLNTIHFLTDNILPGGIIPTIETKRHVFVESTESGFFSIPLSIFNSNAILPPNRAPNTNGEYNGSILIRTELTLEYFTTPTKTVSGTETSIHAINQDQGVFTVPTEAIAGNTLADLNLSSAAVTYSQISVARDNANQNTTAETENQFGFVIVPQMAFEYDSEFLHFDINARLIHSLLPVSYNLITAPSSNIEVRPSEIKYEQKEGPLAFFLGAGIGIIF